MSQNFLILSWRAAKEILTKTAVDNMEDQNLTNWNTKTKICESQYDFTVSRLVIIIFLWLQCSKSYIISCTVEESISSTLVLA